MKEVIEMELLVGILILLAVFGGAVGLIGMVFLALFE